MRLSKHGIGYLEGLLSAVVNIALFAVKVWVGRRAGSVAMIADAWHTLSDTLTSLVVVFGFWLASRKPDKRHPFGHGRAELVAAIVIGTMLAVVSVSFLRDSLLRLGDPRPVDFDRAVLVVFSVSVVLKEALAQFSLRMGRRLGSRSLVADGWHHRSDAVASALILLGAAVARRLWWIDGVLGVGVSLLIAYASYQIIRDAANPLLGEEPDEDTTRGIRELVKLHAPEASDVHHIHVHRYGERAEVTFHVRFPEGTSLEHAHRVASNLEERIRQSLGVEATIHLEPRDRSGRGRP